VISDIDSLNALKTKGPELNEAFLAKDAKKVSSIFQACFATITSHQRHEEEKDYHAFVHVILSTLGFNALSEVSGAEGRMDLLIHLPGDIYLIIELKYCPKPKKLTKNEENELLAKKALLLLPEDLRTSCLSKEVQKKLTYSELEKLLSELSQQPSSETEYDYVLAKEAEKILDENEKMKALAELVRQNIDDEKLNEIFMEVSATAEPDLSLKQINSLLSKSARDALRQITKNDYPGPIKLNAKKIIKMGLAVYGYGNPVKVAFR
jgi:hypothetical protein